VLRERPGLEPQRFGQLGITLAVLEPGKPSGLYHAESAQEDFLGRCADAGEDAGLPRADHDVAERGLRRLPALATRPSTASPVGATSAER
jgi:hypothetical protein